MVILSELMIYCLEHNEVSRPPPPCHLLIVFVFMGWKVNLDLCMRVWRPQFNLSGLPLGTIGVSRH